MTQNLIRSTHTKTYEFTNSFWYLGLLCFGIGLTGIFLLLEWRSTGSFGGVALDDSWIHFRFADNLRHGLGFAFNPGMNTPGSTSPLWVVVLGLLGLGYVMPAKVLGVMAYLGCGLMVFKLGKAGGLAIPYAFLTGASTLAAGRLAWAAPSGMETTAFTLATLAALGLWQRDQTGGVSPLTSFFFGVAILLRPEGVLLFGLSVIVGLNITPFSIRERKSLINLLQHVGIAGAVILPYFAFNLMTSGNLLTNTFYAKSSTWGCQTGWAYFGWIGAVFTLDNPVMAALAAAGLAVLFRSGLWKRDRFYTLAGLWLVALPLLYGILAPCISGYYTRYTTPLIPVMMLFGAFGGQQVARSAPGWLRRIRWRANMQPMTRLIYALLAEGALLALAPAIFFWAPFYAQSVADIGEMHEGIGRWLAENTAEDDVLALNDIGAIGYLSDRQVIDLGGLISPEVLPLIEGRAPGEWDEPLAGYLIAKQPDYLVIFPNWYPELARGLPVREVYRVQLEPRSIGGIANLTVAGGGKMVVYELDWTKDWPRCKISYGITAIRKEGLLTSWK